MKRFAIIASIAMLFLALGCKKNNQNEPVQPQPEPQPQPESIIGNVSAPAWTAPEDYDMPSSMTAVVKIDLSSLYTAEQLSGAGYQLKAEDKVAAFAGDECLGVIELQNGLFFVYINAPKTDSDITLKYYSSVLKHIYADKESFPFINDTQLGSAGSPYTPIWTIEK